MSRERRPRLWSMLSRGRSVVFSVRDWVRSCRPKPPEWARSNSFKVAITTGLIVAVFGSILTVFVWPSLQALNDPASIADQLTTVRVDAAQEDLATVVDRRVDLQRSGRAAYLFVFRHRSLGPLSGAAPAAVSDNIRIYTEDNDGRLELDFNFQPEPLRIPVTVGLRRANREAGLPSPRPGRTTLTFQVATVRDLDGNDRPELLGAYFRRHMTDVDPIPVVVAWSDRSSAYRLYPLLTKPLQLRRLSHPGPYAEAKRADYREPVVLRDTRSDFETTAFSVGGFGVARTAFGQPGLVASFIGRASSHADPRTLELKAAVVSYEDAPRTQECFAAGLTHPKSSVVLDVADRPRYLVKYSGYFGEIARRIARKFNC